MSLSPNYFTAFRNAFRNTSLDAERDEESCGEARWREAFVDTPIPPQHNVDELLQCEAGSLFIVGDRGSGKTTLRRYLVKNLRDQCFEAINFSSESTGIQVLPVEYIAHDDPDISSDAHIRRLCDHIDASLSRLSVHQSRLRDTGAVSEVYSHTKIWEKMKRLREDDIELLIYQLDAVHDIEGKTLRDKCHSIIKFCERRDIVDTLESKIDSIVISANRITSTVGSSILLEKLDACTEAGIKRIAIFVDNVDSPGLPPTSASRARAYARRIDQLLANSLLIIKEPRLSFRFFVTPNVYARLVHSFDPASIPVLNLSWTEADLRKVLNQRMLAFTSEWDLWDPRLSGWDRFASLFTTEATRVMEAFLFTNEPTPRSMWHKIQKVIQNHLPSYTPETNELIDVLTVLRALNQNKQQSP